MKKLIISALTLINVWLSIYLFSAIHKKMHNEGNTLQIGPQSITRLTLTIYSHT